MPKKLGSADTEGDVLNEMLGLIEVVGELEGDIEGSSLGSTLGPELGEFE